MGLDSRSCVNAECGKTDAEEWRRGWALRSGGFANLCGNCGMAYEKSVFCDVFHLKESGWRECNRCGKRLHCGCVSSTSIIVLLDNGGVECLDCAKNADFNAAHSEVFLDSFPHLSTMSVRASHKITPNRWSSLTEGTIDFQRQRNVPAMEAPDSNGSLNHMKREDIILSVRDLGLSNFPILNQAGSCTKIHSWKEVRSFETIDLGCLGISLGTSSHHVQKTQPKSHESNPPRCAEASTESFSHLRMTKPPAEGRSRSNLLPRYWPRITEQELKQISGDSNSIIVPLFDKVLSASDAGRIGRLVLPKACAEAYLPPISQPEGLPLRIQDAKGRDWVFQFRFWPNNNSRMYVLEGVTSCIQSMQLQAGDTVTFSRIEPEGKLLMGFRKATNSLPSQVRWDSPLSAFANGKESFLAGVIERLQSPSHAPVKRRSRNITSKRKRLRMECEDALDLKVTWEEAQELLHAPPNSAPSIVVIDDYEFEEYEEPPVLGKKTIFSTRTSGGTDQWVQCDDCHKLRRLPADAVVLSKWVCSENFWDPERSSCANPSELVEKDFRDLLLQSADLRRKHSAEEAAGLNTLAATALLGDDTGQAALAAAATTRHPRHRLGCSCIVCIQPPSGKGPKHKLNCFCNVCITVRRRFKTLMLRKKKRQREQLPDPCSSSLCSTAPPSELAEIDLNSQPERGGNGRSHMLYECRASSSSGSGSYPTGLRSSVKSGGCGGGGSSDDWLEFCSHEIDEDDFSKDGID
ncbi:B3 domain-containing protein Os07g0679700-like [Wolffia australiana]